MGPIHRRDFLKAVGVTAATTALSAGEPTLRAAPVAGAGGTGGAGGRPNILVFLTDDHGQWAQHAYGNGELHTPNMDRLANRGVRMTQAFTTCPVCSPARASFYTGRTPSQHGIHDFFEETRIAYTHPGLRGQTTIAQILHGVGYRVGLVGKWHCGREREVQPGFDRWFSFWVNQYPHEGRQHFSDQGKQVVEQGQQSPFFTNRAVEFLQDWKKTRGTGGRGEEPFFLVVGYTDTHAPFIQHPKDLVDSYRHDTFRDIPEEKFLAVHGSARTPASSNPAVERESHAQYYAAASMIDEQVGKVLAGLEATGEMDNTLIVYVSDHGLNAGQHGIWNKGNATIPQNFLEESIKVPCLISWPRGGITVGGTCDAMTDHTDLFNTLLEAAGAVPDEAMRASINSPGRSYLPMLRGRAMADWRSIQFCEYGNARMARTDRYKLILRYSYKGVNFLNELYDLKSDPRETQNRFPDPATADLVKDLSAQIVAHFTRYTVPGHSGLELEKQPDCTPNSPWILAAQMKR